MSTMKATQIPDFSSSSLHGVQRRYGSGQATSSLSIMFNPSSSMKWKHEQPILKLQHSKTAPRFGVLTKAASGRNKPESSDDESDDEEVLSMVEFLHSEYMAHFGLKNKMEFTVTQATEDAEFMASAMLRAQRLYEGQVSRAALNEKKRYFEREFHDLKRRCNSDSGAKCFCIIAVKKEEKNENLTLLDRMVGTLDLSVTRPLPGETYPWEPQKPFSSFSFDEDTSARRYGYLKNFVVSRHARRQGIGTKLLHFAIEAAKSEGLDKVCGYVFKDNKAAHELYQKMGFQKFACPETELDEVPLTLVLLRM